MSDLASVMAELEASGSEQTRKTYRRHGLPEPMFGVSFAKLGELTKRLKKQPALALELWDTGNADARHLAMMLADPAALSPELLRSWALSSGVKSIAGSVGDLAAKGPHALSLAQAWTQAPEELLQRAGWNLVATLAMGEAANEATLRPFLAQLEAGFHEAPNWVREGRQNALMAIGTRSEALFEEAKAVALRIGKVHIDHGDTGCKTPDTVPYMTKSRAHRLAKEAKAAAKAAEKAQAKAAKGKA